MVHQQVHRGAGHEGGELLKEFEELEEEVRGAIAPVWAGIHFRSACRGGLALGEGVGRRAVGQYLQPYRN